MPQPIAVKSMSMHQKEVLKAQAQAVNKWATGKHGHAGTEMGTGTETTKRC